MLRNIAWAALTIAAALGLLWAAQEHVPAVSGLGDLNNIAGIGSFVLASVSSVFLFVWRGEGPVSPAADDKSGSPQQATIGSGHVVQTGGDQSVAIQVSGDRATVNRYHGTTFANGVPAEKSSAPGWLHTAVRAKKADLNRLGVHAARPGADGGRQPPYVVRDADADLDALLRVAAADSRGELVLLAGAPLAGKTRALAAALARTLPERMLVVPSEEADLRPLPGWLTEHAAHAPRGWVVWLDDLDRHLPHAHLDPALLNELGTAGAVVVATIRLNQLNAMKPSSASTNGRIVGYTVLKPPALVLSRTWSSSEHERAARSGDARLAEAAGREKFGVAEYVAAGPELERVWKHGPDTGSPRGYALVAAAVDLARTGMSAPMTRAQLEEVTEFYLPAPPPAPEDAEVAWEWAIKVRNGVAGLLVPADPDKRYWRAFDYLTTEAPVPKTVWRAALDWAGDEDRFAIGITAYAAGRHAIAETAWRPAAENGCTTEMFSLGVLLREGGRTGEAVQWYRRAADNGDIEAMAGLGALLVQVGRTGEAEMWWRRAADNGDIDAMAGLGALLKMAGRTEEAEYWHCRAREAGEEG